MADNRELTQPHFDPAPVVRLVVIGYLALLKSKGTDEALNNLR